MMRFWQFIGRRWYYFPLWLVTLVASSLGTLEVMQSPWFAAVDILSAQTFEVIGPAHNRINILYTYTHNRNCPTTQVRWLWRWAKRNGKDIKMIVPLDTAMVPISNPHPGEVDQIIGSYQIPPNIERGDWFFVSKTMDWCGVFSELLGPSIHQTPDIPVRILNSPH